MPSLTADALHPSTDAMILRFCARAAGRTAKKYPLHRMTQRQQRAALEREALHGLVHGFDDGSGLAGLSDELSEVQTGLAALGKIKIKKLAKKVAKPVAKVVKPIAKPVAKVVKPIAKPVAKVVKPIAKPLAKIAKPIVKPLVAVVPAAAPVALALRTAKPLKKIAKPLLKTAKPVAAAAAAATVARAAAKPLIRPPSPVPTVMLDTVKVTATKKKKRPSNLLPNLVNAAGAATAAYVAAKTSQTVPLASPEAQRMVENEIVQRTAPAAAPAQFSSGGGGGRDIDGGPAAGAGVSSGAAAIADGGAAVAKYLPWALGGVGVLLLFKAMSGPSPSRR